MSTVCFTSNILRRRLTVTVPTRSLVLPSRTLNVYVACEKAGLLSLTSCMMIVSVVWAVYNSSIHSVNRIQTARVLLSDK